MADLLDYQHILTGETRQEREAFNSSVIKVWHKTFCGEWILERDNHAALRCDDCEAARIIASPDHYTATVVESIDFIKSVLGPDGFKSYCHGSALKYLNRAGKKDDFSQDMRKAARFCMWAAGDDWREIEKE